MHPNEWEMIDDGSWNGLQKWIRATDEDHGTVQVAYHQKNMAEILDANKQAQNDGFDRKSEMWHAASIPPIVEIEWLTKYGVRLKDPNHGPAVKRLLNSSEYRHLKRAPIVL
jgi:hypothetical protein